MHFTLLVAGALLPAEAAAALSASLDAPDLKARIARAALKKQAARGELSCELSAGGNAHLDWLSHKLFSRAAPAPTAPYSYAHLAGAVSRAFIWHADPVHIEVARDHLIVQALETGARVRAEASRLMSVANPLASGLACQFVSAGDRWFLQSEHDWVLDTAPLAAVIEAPIAMPAGKDAQTWNRLHNEIQMTWHAHAVNQSRETDRLPTINGIWLHGGGRWQPLPPIAYAHVLSDEPEWRGAAQAAGAGSAPLHADAFNEALFVIDDAWLPKRCEDWADWLRAMTALDRRLASHRADAIDLVFTGSTVRTFESRPSDRYKPWRQRSVADALTE